MKFYINTHHKNTKNIYNFIIFREIEAVSLTRSGEVEKTIGTGRDGTDV